MLKKLLASFTAIVMTTTLCMPVAYAEPQGDDGEEVAAIENAAEETSEPEVVDATDEPQVEEGGDAAFEEPVVEPEEEAEPAVPELSESPEAPDTEEETDSVEQADVAVGAIYLTFAEPQPGETAYATAELQTEPAEAVYENILPVQWTLWEEQDGSIVAYDGFLSEGSVFEAGFGYDAVFDVETLPLNTGYLFTEETDVYVNGELVDTGKLPTCSYGPLEEEVSLEEADDSVPANTLRYSYNHDDMTATVEGLVEGSTATGNLVIPATVEYGGETYTVTTIGAGAFAYKTGFNGTLTLPNTLLTIGASAFDGCTGFTGPLNLPANLKRIDNAAFKDCKNFTGTWSFPSTLTYLGSSAFRDCLHMQGVVNIPAGVTEIGDECFYVTGYSRNMDWVGVTGVTFSQPSQLERIGAYAFAGNWYITGGLNIPEGVTEIGNCAFNKTYVGNSGEGYEGTLTLPSTIKTIGEGAFQSCGFSGDLVIPQSLTAADATLGKEAFDQAGFTGNLVLPEGLTYVEEACFRNCDFTGTLVLPSTLQAVGTQAFGGLSDMSGSLAIPASMTEIESGAFYAFGGHGELILPDTLVTIGGSAFNSSNLSGALVIPDSVESIGYSAFEDCRNFISLKLPDNPNFTKIEGNTFKGSSSYPMGFSGELVIPDSVTEIGGYAFEGCKFFTGTLDLPDGLTSVDREAFRDCSGFTGLTLPNGLATIGYRAFYYCSSLTGDLTIPGSVKTIDEDAFYGCRSLDGELSIDEGVQTLGDDAFCGCEKLKGTASIPSTVTSLGEGVFSGCSSLEGYEFPAGITSIPRDLFTGCSGMTGELVIPDTVTEIGYGAFRGCSGLTGTLTIPNGVTKIDDYTFDGCSGLTGTLTIPSSVTYIDWYAFQNCSGLTGTLVIPDNVTNIGMGAFAGCSGFTGDLTLPSAVKSLGSDAFEDCTGLTGTLTIPASVTSIGSSTLYRTSFSTIVNQSERSFSASNITYPTCDYYQDSNGNKVDDIATGTYTRVQREGIDLAAAATVDPIPDQQYTGAYLKPPVTVKVDGVVLTQDTDYTVTYSYNRYVGTARVTISGKRYQGYTNSIETTFQIVDTSVPSVENATVSGIPSWAYYTGSAIKPDPTVKLGSTTLVKNTDYTVSYKNNTKVGQATVTITGKGSYTGAKSVTFEIYWNTIAKNVRGTGTVELRPGYDASGAQIAGSMHAAPGTTVVFRTIPGAGQYTSAFNVQYDDPATGAHRTLTVANGGLERRGGTGAAGTTAEYAFAMPDCDVSINATFSANTKTYKITKNLTGTGKAGSNLMLVGSDGKVAGQTADSVAPTMNPRAGQKVYFKSVPAKGARLTRFNVTYTYTGLDGKKVTTTLITGKGITSHGGGLYSFTMPCYPVTLTGEFTK